ncbi:type I restriction enzyme HsdR N-terminal domain-containing protein [Dysgonomonas sp. 520]|uniref:type I restriction enzyme HsdR N-terminal domain-containing protein n=1 Tax=Dysgonomonas sp. 520 TaxID=2302931 RepID=UPI0013D3BFD6|nr:type I restriction enzyme HsdR N-terminal domain-containing protein [Dysgonomonas sp. 520]NDW11078.1 hypothetical protein [Dysgonomonas sp. 520]
MAKKTAKKNSKVTKDGFERISIWQANVGDLVCYITSEKIYIIADKTEDMVSMVSATQQFNAKYSFDVKRVLRVEDVNEENYSTLLNRLPYSEKNITLSNLLQIADEYTRTGVVSKATLDKIQPATNKLLESQQEVIEFTPFEYKLPENWNADEWFDKIQAKVFRTEKEVETKFILPLLTQLGYNEDDRYDAMLIEGAEGSRKVSLEIDFAMFANETEEIKEQTILIVEAKKEHRLTKQVEIEKAQRQARSYAIWTGCKFGLITDSRTIQVLDIMPNIGSYKVLFECQRSELKNRFEELYNLVGKERLRDYYLELV